MSESDSGAALLENLDNFEKYYGELGAQLVDEIRGVGGFINAITQCLIQMNLLIR